MMHKRVVVVADDDEELRELLVAGLAREDRRVVELEDGSELRDYLAFFALKGHVPDLVVTDVHMPGESGLEVVSWARAQGLSCPFIILTGHADERLRAAGVRLGATRVLGKPQTLGALRRAVDDALSPPAGLRAGP